MVPMIEMTQAMFLIIIIRAYTLDKKNIVVTLVKC